jgi:hypothetical protein
MNLDIETTVRTIFIMLLVGAGALVMLALRAFREAGRLRFFLKKRALLGRAWQFVFFAALTVVVAFLINGFAEPATYKFFEPSPTPTNTPTITSTPTITQTPTITNTPTITPTLEFTPTPELPAVISQDFTSEVTPNAGAVFSGIAFSRSLDDDYQPIDADDTFENPVDKIHASYSFNNMTLGTQWTALWFRDGELLDYETLPWRGASGGYDFALLDLPGEEWLPGEYELQLYIGSDWEVTGNFTVTGLAPTPTITPTPTQTLSPTATQTSTITPTASATAVPSGTPVPTGTLANTPVPSRTAAPTRTATLTRTPTLTRTATLTRTSTATLVPSATSVPTITLVPTATRRSTIYR